MCIRDSFFKGLVGVAQDNDVASFKELVDKVQSGAVGRRERGVIRTPLETEVKAKEVAGRGITRGDIGLETGKRGRPLTPRQVINKVRQDLDDAPEVIDESMFSLRLDRAADQGFDTSTVYYHGTASPSIKQFRSRIPTAKGVIAGHFTLDPEFASGFVPAISREGEAGTVYPVFLRANNTFDYRKPEMMEAVSQEVAKGRNGGGHKTASNLLRSKAVSYTHLTLPTICSV